LITFFFYLEALDAQLQVLHQTAKYAATTVNARGALLAERLQDISNRVRDIAGHGVRQGAATALAMVQTQLDVHNFDRIPVAEPPELFRLKCASHHYAGDINSMHFKRNIPLVCRVTARFNHGYSGSR
jgi:hypothetical protein